MEMGRDSSSTIILYYHTQNGPAEQAGNSIFAGKVRKFEALQHRYAGSAGKRQHGDALAPNRQERKPGTTMKQAPTHPALAQQPRPGKSTVAPWIFRVMPTRETPIISPIGEGGGRNYFILSRRSRIFIPFYPRGAG